MADGDAIIRWLLDSDPAIRWQVLRDLTDGPPEAVTAERSRIAHEGWGAELLASQAPAGDWGDEQEHGWMTTTDTLHLLKEMGADPADEKVRRAVDLVQERINWYQLDGRPFFDGETEACINGRILGSAAYFGAPCDRLLDRLLSEQLEDGGWNCDAPPSTRSSFHSTICVLEGLLDYEKAHGPTTSVTEARRKGEEYLLSRRMIRSLRTGQVVDERWTRFSFPVAWFYDVLRGLDYFRAAGAEPDERVGEAVEIVRERADDSGRWTLDDFHPDRARVPLELETEVGAASRWNTLRALRVLDWASEGRGFPPEATKQSPGIGV